MGYIPGLTEYTRGLGKGDDWNIGVRSLRHSYILPDGITAFEILNGGNTYRTARSGERPVYVAFDSSGKRMDNFSLDNYQKADSYQDVVPVTYTPWKNGRASKYQLKNNDGSNYDIAIDKDGNYWISSLDPSGYSRVFNPEAVKVIENIIKNKLTVDD